MDTFEAEARWWELEDQLDQLTADTVFDPEAIAEWDRLHGAEHKALGKIIFATQEIRKWK